MSTSTHDQPATSVSTPRKLHKYRTPPGHRVLHLVIPAETFALIHKAAIDSEMKFSAYMNRFLKEAFPFTAVGQPTFPTPFGGQGRPQEIGS
jgi:hypothetical protein